MKEITGKHEEEPIIFTEEVKKIGGSLKITIPIKEAKFLGIDEGDLIRVWIKKIKEWKRGKKVGKRQTRNNNRSNKRYNVLLQLCKL